MKESKISQQFEEVAERLRKNEDVSNVLTHLAIIRDVVRELQDAGMKLSLDVRPGSYQSPIPLREEYRQLVNGTISVDSVALDFVIVRTGWTTPRFEARMGSDDIAVEYLRDGNELRDKLTTAILEVQARFSMLDEFNVDETGHAGVRKPIAVIKQLQLKNTPKP